MEHKLEKAIVDGQRRDVQVAHFIILIVPIFSNFPDNFLFTSLVFSNDRWHLTAPFVDNSQVLLNN